MDDFEKTSASPSRSKLPVPIASSLFQSPNINKALFLSCILIVSPTPARKDPKIQPNLSVFIPHVVKTICRVN